MLSVTKPQVKFYRRCGRTFGRIKVPSILKQPLAGTQLRLVCGALKMQFCTINGSTEIKEIFQDQSAI